MYSVWFSVSAPANDDEFVGVVGSNEELGSWKLPDSKLLTYDPSSKEWKIEIKFLKRERVQYRYFIGQRLVENGKEQELLVRRWECHVQTQGRWFDAEDGLKLNNKFGMVNGIERVDQGWLCGQMEVHINVSEVNGEPCFKWLKNNPDLGIENMKISGGFKGAIKSEVSILSPYSVQSLEQNCPANMPHGKEEYLSYVAEVKNLEDMLLEFRILEFNENVLGHVWVLGSMLDGSIGARKLAVIGVDGKPVGTLRIEYLVVKPYKNEKMTMEETYSLHWKPRGTLNIGHRGAGNSFTAEKVSDLYENTISSLQKASEHSAAMIEFDVQLTKDKIPIIYHDLNLCAVIGAGLDSHLHEIEIRSMTYDELKKYNLRHKSRKNSNRELKFNECDTRPFYKPFPTLEETFKEVPLHTGFNVEVKWPNLYVDGTWDDDVSADHYFDANEFLDKILDVVFEHGGKRRVVFSCFNANLVAMLRRKQNRYPVLYLNNGETGHYKLYEEPRSQLNSMAAAFTMSRKLLGLVTLERDVYADHSQVKRMHDHGLKLFVYGSMVHKNIKLLTDLELDGIIYDMIHDHLPPGQNVFQVKSD